MAKNGKIIDEMHILLQNGKTRAEIMAINAKKWQMTTRTADRYLKDANKMLLDARKAVNVAVTEVIVQEAAEAVRMGLKTDLEIEMQLLKIGFGEMDIVETTSNNNGTTVYQRNPTPAEQRAALETVYKRRGSFAAEKHQVEITEPIIIEWWNNEESK
jgi:hypothetical protein